MKTITIQLIEVRKVCDRLKAFAMICKGLFIYLILNNKWRLSHMSTLNWVALRDFVTHINELAASKALNTLKIDH